MKKTLVVSIFLICLMLILSPSGFAGEPGPGVEAGERLVGPTIDGVLGIINNSTGGIDVSIAGICNGQNFTAALLNYLPNIDLTTVVASNLIGWRVDTDHFPEVAGICNPKPGLEFMIVDAKNFANYSNNPSPIRQVIAQVTIMFVEAKK